MDRHQLPVIVHVLLLVGDAVLLLRRSGTGRADGFWAPPGGHLEAGELPRSAACRELAEEAGIALAPERLEPHQAYFYLDDGGDGVNVLFRVRLDEAPALSAAPGAPHDALELHPIDALPEPCLPWVRRALEALGEAGDSASWYVEGGRRRAPGRDRG